MSTLILHEAGGKVHRAPQRVRVTAGTLSGSVISLTGGHLIHLRLYFAPGDLCARSNPRFCYLPTDEVRDGFRRLAFYDGWKGTGGALPRNPEGDMWVEDEAWQELVRLHLSH